MKQEPELKLDFEISNEAKNSVDTGLLINILAAQQATTHVLINMMAVDSKEAAHFISEFDRLRNSYANDITEYIFKEHAVVNIQSITNNK